MGTMLTVEEKNDALSGENAKLKYRIELLRSAMSAAIIEDFGLNRIAQALQQDDALAEI